MAKIPEEHKKYNLLRKSAGRDDRECFSYPDLSIFENLGIFGLDPYGYNSVEAYNHMIDERINALTDEKLINLYRALQQKMIRRNKKEFWSVLRYIGPDMGDLFGLRHGETYYWPCDVEHPIYEGVIDEEEYTSYLYATKPDMWEILEDPTGMAYDTIYKKKNYVSAEKLDDIVNQVKMVEEE